MKAAIIATRDGLVALFLGAVVFVIGVLALLIIVFTLDTILNFFKGT